MRQIMNKAIFIGELALNIELKSDGTATILVGDWAVNASVLDGRMGVDTSFVGEAAADVVGDYIVSYLTSAGVGVKSVDRYTEGVSPLRVTSDTVSGKTVGYEQFPSEPVNAVWPRIDEGDVVVFGSYMALEERDHDRLMDLLKYAKARKALIVYLPYFQEQQVPRITRVMPAVFDDLELADIVVARTEDIKRIFPGEDMGAVFKDHILFYCRRFLHIDAADKLMRFYDGDASWTEKCHPADHSDFQWYSGALAGLTRALTEGMRDPEELMRRADETAHSELAGSV